jgi:hypothetical protein
VRAASATSRSRKKVAVATTYRSAAAGAGRFGCVEIREPSLPLEQLRERGAAAGASDHLDSSRRADPRSRVRVDPQCAPCLGRVEAVDLWLGRGQQLVDEHAERFWRAVLVRVDENDT